MARGEVAVVLFTRDLRVHDHPALAEAARQARRVVPLFVFDREILAGEFAAANRLAFMLAALGDLRASLRRRGADLVVRHGDPVHEAVRLASAHGAGAVHATADVSEHARRRQERLRRACAAHRLELRLLPGVTVVPPGELHPSGGGDHYRVFTPYWRAWSAQRWRAPAPAPRALALPDGLDPGPLPALADLARGEVSPDLVPGGEAAGRRRWHAWRRRGLAAYADRHDDLPGDRTSRIGPYIHFGCLSPLELATGALDGPGGEAFARQLCWRDFHHQVTAAFPAIARRDYRPARRAWRSDAAGLAAWKQGRTGWPIVDAGMRQLRAEGWMHNRARLIVASFLVKDLGVDWRLGAAHFLDWLVDGDVANNSGNWQWVAGTGNDTRPNRVLNVLRQADRHDPAGDYVRRYVPELAGIAGSAVHRPWALDDDRRRRLDYPAPLVDPARPR